MDDERKPLLKALDSIPSISTCPSPADEPENKDHAPARRKIIIEPAYILYCFVIFGGGQVIEQYLYARFKDDYPILSNHTHVPVSKCDENHSDPVFIATQGAQAETTKWLMYSDITRSAFEITLVLFYGGYSDCAGRKVVILLPVVANAVKLVMIFFTVLFHLPVYCLLVGATVEGLAGGFMSMIMGVTSYIADTCPKETRAFRITILSACNVLASALSRFLMGFFVKNAGFVYPIATYCVLQCITVVYILLFVPETLIIKDPKKRFLIMGVLRKSWHVFTKKENKRHLKLVLLTLMEFFYIIPLGGHGLQVLYVLNMPLCWGPVLIGIYSAATALGDQFSGLISLKVLQKFQVPELKIAALGTVSAITGCLLNAWATHDWMMYLVSAVSFLVALPPPLFRAKISCLLRPEEQGTVFAIVALIETASYLTLNMAAFEIYKHTLFIMPGVTYLFCGCLGGLSLFFIIIYLLTGPDEHDKR